MSTPQRREPLPGVLGMPRFLWRKLGRRGRVAVVVVALALVAGVVAAWPGIERSKREQARAERRQFRTAVRDDRRRNAREQAPHSERVPAGRALVPALEAAITADAHARLRAGRLPPPPVRTTVCHDASRELPHTGARARRHGGTVVRCIAYTTLRRTAAGQAYGVGFEFLGVVARARRTVVWCKTNPLPGEKFGGVTLADVPLARACTDPRG